MNKATINNLFLGLSIVLVGSCKPALKVSSDYDRTVNFSEYKTFSLLFRLYKISRIVIIVNNIKDSIKATKTIFFTISFLF